jgi:hypothetical protein
VVELDDGHGDRGDQKMIKCFTFGKEERENKKWAQGKGICDRAFLFCTQDTIEGVSDLGSIPILLRGEILG